VKKIRVCLVLFLCLFIKLTSAQSITLNGTVYGTADVEGIHVINKTLRKATTTDNNGAFSINAKLNDTLVFSGVQYKLESISVDKEMIETKLVKVFLLENINQLDEVVVGKVLTGDLLSDIENIDAKEPINFYDVGIPGYKGKPKTKNERLLHEAGEFKPIMLLGLLAGGLPLNPIINGLSGRTKELKNRVKLEARDELMFRVKAKYSEDLFAENPLEEILHYEYFYFCSEDSNFMEKCSINNDLLVFEFLQQKLVDYKLNLKN